MLRHICLLLGRVLCIAREHEHVPPYAHVRTVWPYIRRGHSYKHAFRHVFRHACTCTWRPRSTYGLLWQLHSCTFFAPNLKTLDTCADRCDNECSGQNRRDTDDHHCVHGYALGYVCRHVQKQMSRHEQTGVPLLAVRRTVMAVAIIPPRRISASTCT